MTLELPTTLNTVSEILEREHVDKNQWPLHYALLLCVIYIYIKTGKSALI